MTSSPRHRLLVFCALLGFWTSCVLAPYQPLGKACDEEHACPGGLACVSGVCGECGNTGECTDGKVCVSGTCGGCSASSPCPSGESCTSAGTCVASCTSTLQSLVDASAPGSVVVVPACVYRETLNLAKAITLSARAGAEIRGSDVWSTWTPSGAQFIGGTLTAFPPHGGCASGTSRCQWPEQVFLDGVPLVQVSSSTLPAPGQFSVNAGRAVVLGDNPAGRTVEVTVRRRWVNTQSDQVTLRGLTFRHAASNTTGAISNDGRSAWRLEQSRLNDVHGVALTVDHGTGVVATGNSFLRSGQLGVFIDSASGVRVENNVLQDVNTESFTPDSMAGGMTLTAASDTTLSGNTVANGRGMGIECQRDCANVTITGNRVHHLKQRGIMFGSSVGGEIANNVVWESGWEDSIWAWGGGIVVHSASEVLVHDNLVAWCPDGIAIISQTQTNPRWLVKQVFVHDNQVFGTDDVADYSLWNLDLGWAEDWSGGTMFSPASGNRGQDNRFWNDQAENSDTLRFAWGSSPVGIPYLQDFAKLPGGQGSVYVTVEQKNAVLTEAKVPLFPEPH
jgi:nitrous oxidase accessory protein NosD